MNPNGSIKGNQLNVSWKHHPGATIYSLSVEDCGADISVCRPIFHSQVQADTSTASAAGGPKQYVTETSNAFAPCVVYNVKLTALNSDSKMLQKAAFLFNKDQGECGRLFQTGLTAAIVIIGLLIVLCLGTLICYHRRRPLQRLQKVKSKMYSRLYSKAHYERPIVKSDFAKRSCELISDPTGPLMDEFDELEQISSDTIHHKALAADANATNRKRNRYQDVVPYDTNRIRLHEPVRLEGEEEASDFVNASAVCGFNGKPLCYIAAQGPGDDTSHLFWQMVWQQNVRVIVMLTNLVEGFGFNSVKCSQYWPQTIGTCEIFRDIQVHLHDSQETPTYTIRKLEIRKCQEGSDRYTNGREVVQVQCTAWPDRSAPEDPRVLLQMLTVVRSMSGDIRGAPAPWLVHCSAGVGRTGTFIAVDQLLRVAEDRTINHIDIFNTIYNLRKERRHLVQTASQYIYVYKCLRESFKIVETKL